MNLKFIKVIRSSHQRRLEDKGKRGEVNRVLPKDGRVVVQGLELAHQASAPGSISGTHHLPGKVRFEPPLTFPMSCSSPEFSNYPCGTLPLDDGKSMRICKQCEAVIDE